MSVQTATAAQTTAPDRVPGIELAAAVNLHDRDVKVRGTLFLPDGAPRIRCTLTVVEYGSVYLLYDNPPSDWRPLARELECGLMLA